MTLQEFFNLLEANPVWILAFFILVPFTAWLAGILGKGEGHLVPWRYLYSTLVYLSCVPGIFAVTLSIYLFIFERRPILQTGIYTQILPILSMVVTLLLIRRNVDLKDVPGFEKISGLIIVITVALALMWVVDRTRIWVISFLPFWQGILIFAGLLVLLRWGWGRMFERN